MIIINKIKKLIKDPSLFFRDFFEKRYPVIRNEIRCPEKDESVLLRYDIELESKVDVAFPIDVVYTWVNSDCSQWRKKFNSTLGSNDKQLGGFATDRARYCDHNELYYSLISVRKNIPWVRYIYIVTDQQVPDWYESFNYENIKIIDHHDIISEEYLPTFNSHVIEAHLHKIPGLAEHFIYFNDDVFVARPLHKAHFFEANGIASLFLSSKSLRALKNKGMQTPTLSASLRCAQLLNERYNFKPDIPLVHTYLPLRKSLYERAWEEFESEIMSFLNNRFRTDHDLNLASFLIPWLAYAEGKATTKRDICYYFNVRSKSAKEYYKSLRQAKNKDSLPHSFCANDFNTKCVCDDNYSESLNECLKYQFISECDNDKS